MTGGNSTYCGHIVVANGAEQSAQSFSTFTCNLPLLVTLRSSSDRLLAATALQLGGSFPANSTWWSMRVVRMFDADYAITVSPNGTFTDCPGHPGAVQRP